MSGSTAQFDLVGPTADDDVRRLIHRYGADEIKRAVKAQTARKRGRSTISDWPALFEILREGSCLWLEGGNPFAARTNYSIASQIAASVPEHQREATFARLMRKLSARRRYYTFVDAEHLSYTERPFSDNLRTLSELRKIGLMRDEWDQLWAMREGALADYKMKFGEPASEMTMQEVEKRASQPIASNLAGPFGNVLQQIAPSAIVAVD